MRLLRLPPSRWRAVRRWGRTWYRGSTPGAVPPRREGVVVGVRFRQFFGGGLFTAHPRVGYGVTYGTGLRGERGQTEATLLHTFSPTLNVEVGRYWTVGYRPILAIYGSDGFRDALNHAVLLNGALPGRSWNFNVGGRYSLQDTSLIETGRQTKQTQVSSRLGASRALTDVLSLNLGLSQSMRDASEFNKVSSWATQNSIDYRFRENLSAGLVFGMGYDQVEPGSDMMSERVQGQFGGSLGDKLSYNLMAGVEFRQMQREEGSAIVAPIYTGGLNYSVTQGTVLGLSLRQSLSPSFFSDQFNRSTAVNLTASQILFERLALSVIGSYRWNERSGIANPTERQQRDELVSVRVALSTGFLRRGSMSVFWSWMDNTSTQRGLGFSSEQVGLNVSYGF